MTEEFPYCEIRPESNGGWFVVLVKNYDNARSGVQATSIKEARRKAKGMLLNHEKEKLNLARPTYKVRLEDL